MKLYRAQRLSALVRPGQGLKPQRRDWDEWPQLERHPEFEFQRHCLAKLGIDSVLDPLDSFPLHPSVVFLMPRLADKLDLCLESALRGEGRGGLDYFLVNYPVVQPPGRLSLYTLDHLYRHLEKRLAERLPTIAQQVEEALRGERTSLWRSTGENREPASTGLS